MASYRFIPPDEMERITEKVLIDSQINVAYSGGINRIDIDAIIEFGYGLEIAWENIDALSKEGIVLAVIKPKDKLILMNSSQESLFKEKIGTMNFSKAHELGHWVLHVTDQGAYEQLSFDTTEIYYCRSFNKRPPEELQADMFASSLLMPKPIITGAIDDLKKKRNVSFSDLYELKDLFEVSISALVTRINRLELLFIGEDKKIYTSKDAAQGQQTLF